ncbi:putative ribonuclease H-like domain-containing protein [Tanacetum coccineum]
MALMAFSDSEVYNDKTCSKTCLKNYETLKKQCDKRGLATVEEQLITYRKNEVLFSKEVTVLKREVACKDYEINVFKTSKYLDKLLESQITNKSKKDLGYSVVPPPHPLIYNRTKKLDLSYSGLDEFKGPEFKGYGSEDRKKESNVVCDKKLDDSKENSNNSLVKEQVSKDTSSFVESSLNVDKETVFPVDKKIESVKPKNNEKPVKKSVRYAEMYRSQTPRGNQRNWNEQKSNQLGIEFVMYNKACFICGSFNHVQAQYKYHQKERMVYGNNYNRVNYNYTTKRNHHNAQRNMVPRAVLMKTGLKTFNTARTVNRGEQPQSTKEARSNLLRDGGISAIDFKEFDRGYVTFGGGAHGGRIFDSLGKFDGKSDEGFFVGYSLSSKAFRVYNTRTRRVEENLHIGFLENKPMIEGNGPKWLFDIYSLTQSMNYVPVAADASYFDSPTQDVDNGELKSVVDDQKQDGDGPDNENDKQDKTDDVSSPKEVNSAGQHVNTASPDVNTGSFKLNVVSPSVNIASSYNQDSLKDMFTMGASHTLEATHLEFFSDEDEPEVDLGNITNSYTVPTTPNTKIHKDHPIENVIGDVKSSVQTRRMTKPTSEQGFLDAIYEQKTHDTLNTCLYACFLSQIEPTSIAKPLSDSSCVEAMQEEFLQFKLQQVWILVDMPIVKRAIGTKWVFKNKKDERGIMIRNKERRGLCTQINHQDLKILTINIQNPHTIHSKKTYIRQTPKVPSSLSDKVYNKGQRHFMVCIKHQEHGIETLALQVQQKEDGIFISQDKYVAEILKKFNYTDVKSASTLVDLEKPLVKDGDADDVDVHLYRSMIGSRCLWYSRDSPFELVAYTDSDYAGATQDRKSTTKGCQFLGNRGMSKEVGTPRYLNLVVPLKKVGDEAVHKELGDRMERAATTTSSLEAEQDSGSGPRLHTWKWGGQYETIGIDGTVYKTVKNVA